MDARTEYFRPPALMLGGHASSPALPIHPDEFGSKIRRNAEAACLVVSDPPFL